MWKYLVVTTILPPGVRSLYGQPIFFWSLVLACLASTFIVVLAAYEIRKLTQSHVRKLIAMRQGPIVVIPTEVKAKAARIGRGALLIMMGFGTGWLWKDHQFNATRYVYSDVLVVARHDEQNYTIQPARMQPFKMVTCTPTDWQEGEKMKFLSFTYSARCDRVDGQGWFQFYTNPKGQRLKFPHEVVNVELGY